MGNIECERAVINAVPHDIGNPGEAPWKLQNSYPIHACDQWRDLGIYLFISIYLFICLCIYLFIILICSDLFFNLFIHVFIYFIFRELFVLRIYFKEVEHLFCPSIYISLRFLSQIYTF